MILKIYKKIKNNKFITFCLIIGLILLSLMIYKAITSSITYDEAHTYIYYSKKSIFACFKGYITGNNILANNHILNSFLIAVFTRLFNASYNEFVIRLPNILSYIVFLYYSFKLSKKYKFPYLVFSLLVFNYGLYEYLGMARGYGIASTFVLMGLYYYKEWVNNKKRDDKNLLLVYLLLGLSCYANTICLFVLGTIGIDSLIRLYKKNLIIPFIKKNYLCLIFILIMGIMIIRYHFVISKDGLPLYSSSDTFFNSVIMSYINRFGINNKIMAIITLILYLGITIYSVYKSKKEKNCLAYLIYINVSLIIILTLLCGKEWITGRVLLPFVPLVTLCLMEGIEKIILNKKSSCMVSGLIIISMMALFISNINLNYYSDFEADRYVKELSFKSYYEKNNNEEPNKLLKEALVAPRVFYQQKIKEKYNYDILSFLDDKE